MKKFKKIFGLRINPKVRVLLVIILILVILAGGGSLFLKKDGGEIKTIFISKEDLIKEGEAAAKKHDFQSATSSYEKALNKDSNNIEIKQALGEYYLASKEYDKAREVLLDVLKQNPDDPGLLNAIANCYNQTQKTEEAISYYQKAIEKGNFDSIGNLVTIYNTFGRYDDSIALLSGLTVKYPEDISIKKLLASSYSKKGDSKKAQEILSTIK